MAAPKQGRLRFISIMSICVLAGILIGVFASYTFLKSFFLYSAYSNEAAKTTIEISALRSIRSGNTEKAIEILELGVSASTMILTGSKASAPKSAYKNIEQAISLIRKYESDYGIKLVKSPDGT